MSLLHGQPFRPNAIEPGVIFPFHFSLAPPELPLVLPGQYAGSSSFLPAAGSVSRIPAAPAPLTLRGRAAASPAVVASPTTLGPAEAASAYLRGLAGAEEVIALALAPSTRRQQQAAGREASVWFTRLGMGCDLTTCSPDDLVVYIMSGWLTTHRRQGEADQAPSFNTLKHHLSLLSGLFRRLGRRGEFDPVTGLGNPCQSPEVEGFRKGYTKWVSSGGLVEISAVPLSPPKFRALIDYLWGLIRSARSRLEELLLLRDLLCMLYMWSTSMRGADVGRLRLDDFRDPASGGRRPFGGFPLPLPGPGGSYPTGVSLLVSQFGTKTYQTSRAPGITFVPGADPQTCFLRGLAVYLSLCSSRRSPPGSAVTCYLFRPLAAGGGGFKEAPLSSSALGARLRTHLMNAGLYEGETNHGFRRGTLQEAQRQGASPEELSALGQIRTPAVLKRYLDPHRHLASRDVRPRVQ